MSWHGVFGLVSMLAVSSQFAFSISMLFPRLCGPLFKPVGGYAKMRRLHGKASVLVFAFIESTLILGLATSWFVSNAGSLALPATVGVALAMAGVALQVYRRR